MGPKLKIYVETIYCAHFVFYDINIVVGHWSKNRFLSNLSKNGQFLLNKVQKVTNDEFFFIKYKMHRKCDFHIDF